MNDTNMLNVNGETISVDHEGYLLYPEEWNTDVAQHISELENIQMDNDSWFVVRFVRDYFEERQSVPEARHVLKAMKQGLGEEQGTRKYLYKLFPYGYGQQACKIAGMRVPKKLLLDL